ncbi:MAG: 3-deoxy-7-phosphoheptulonate synthase [Chloroflexota bacterium]
MILAIREGASEQDIAGLVRLIEAAGAVSRTSVSVAGVRIAVRGVTGAAADTLAGELTRQPAVAEILRPPAPYVLVSREFAPAGTPVSVDLPDGQVVFGGTAVVLIAGPCAVESPEQLTAAAAAARAAGATLLRGGAFKPRTSPYSFQSLEEEGLRLLAEARAATGLGIVTEVVDPRDIGLVADYADMLQVGARNMQNFSLLRELGGCGKPVMLKRGIGNTVDEWLMSAEYIADAGNERIVLCERGIRTFEPSTRSTLDLAAVAVAQRRSRFPVIVDPSHASGDYHYVRPLALAAVAAGADGVMIEVHPDPGQALSDGCQSLTPARLQVLGRDLRAVAEAVGRRI